MRRSSIPGWLAVLLIALIGCVGPAGAGDEGAEPLGVGASAVVTENALTSNALTSNALTSNALTSNALTSNALSPAALTAITDPGPAGTLSRAFLRYVVSCALSTSQSFSFSWTDSTGVVHDEAYPGGLAIAPGWATGPLATAGQELVSACVAARVNWYGVSVVISVRSLQSPLLPLSGSAELTNYPNVEGAFWGNLFSSTPHVHSCYNEATVAHSRSLDRDCATGHLNTDGTVSPCGVIGIVGSCQDHCQALNGAGQYYPECAEPQFGKTKNVVTTALP